MPPVAILAGGLATRLWPRTKVLPKALIDVAGQPFIFHQLQLLRGNGITEAVVCAGYLGEQVQARVGDGSDLGIRVWYSFDGDLLLGTGGAIRKALALLGDTFFVLYGDSYLEVDYRDIFTKFQETAQPGLMTVFRNANQWDTSNVLFRNGRILVYDKSGATAGMEHIDYGLSLFRAEAFASYPQDEPFDLTEPMQRLVQDGTLAGLEVFERFYEIGSPEGIDDLSRHLTERSGQ